MPRFSPSGAVRLLAAGTLVVILSSCGGGSDPDTRVLGEQIAQEDTATRSLPAAPAAPTPDTPPAPGAAPAPAESEPAPETPAQRPKSPASPEALTLELQLDATEVAQGDSVRGALVVTNPTGDTIDITHPSSCSTDEGLYADGALASEARACAAVVTPDAIGAGEARSFPVRIPTGDLPPGTYEARAALNLVSGDRSAPPVTVTVV